MNLKLDENIPAEFAEMARRLGHDCETVVGEGLAGAEDDRVARAASDEGRFLITKDLDFSDMRRWVGSPGILVVRARDAGRLTILRLLSDVFATEPVQEWMGCLVVLSPGRLRVRRLSE